MMAVMPQIVDKMTARMCARFGCPADDLSGASGPVNKGASAK